jgi:hypothetical protein
LETVNQCEQIKQDYIAWAGYTSANYSPGHPWYYKLGGRILSVDEIEPMDVDASRETWVFSRKLPKDLKRRRKVMEESIKTNEAQLVKDIANYEDVVARGSDAVSDFDKRMGYGIETYLSLAHNHIRSDKGIIRAIKAALEELVNP